MPTDPPATTTLSDLIGRLAHHRQRAAELADDIHDGCPDAAGAVRRFADELRAQVCDPLVAACWAVAFDRTTFDRLDADARGITEACDALGEAIETLAGVDELWLAVDDAKHAALGRVLAAVGS